MLIQIRPPKGANYHFLVFFMGVPLSIFYFPKYYVRSTQESTVILKLSKNTSTTDTNPSLRLAPVPRYNNNYYNFGSVLWFLLVQLPETTKWWKLITLRLIQRWCMNLEKIINFLGSNGSFHAFLRRSQYFKTRKYTLKIQTGHRAQSFWNFCLKVRRRLKTRGTRFHKLFHSNRINFWPLWPLNSFQFCSNLCADSRWNHDTKLEAQNKSKKRFWFFSSGYSQNNWNMCAKSKTEIWCWSCWLMGTLP